MSASQRRACGLACLLEGLTGLKGRDQCRDVTAPQALEPVGHDAEADGHLYQAARQYKVSAWYHFNQAASGCENSACSLGWSCSRNKSQEIYRKEFLDLKGPSPEKELQAAVVSAERSPPPVAFHLGPMLRACSESAAKPATPRRGGRRPRGEPGAGAGSPHAALLQAKLRAFFTRKGRKEWSQRRARLKSCAAGPDSLAERCFESKRLKLSSSRFTC